METKTYEDDIYEFLTQEKHFLGLISAKKHLPKVKERLVLTFWDDVKKALELAFSDKGWNILSEDPYSSFWHTKLGIFPADFKYEDNGLPPIYIGVENLSQGEPYIGFWQNLNCGENKEHYHSFFEETSSNFQALMSNSGHWEFSDKSEWWPVWKYITDLNFIEEESYVHILPENRGKKVSLIIDSILELVEVSEGIFEAFRPIHLSTHQ
jgi:hypothetical protein